MRLHRNLVFTTIDSLMAIFNEGEYADKVVARALKKDKRWGSHDRKFVAETIYEIVRWKRLYVEIAEVKEPFDRDNIWRIFAVWAVLRGYNLPDWKYFEETPVRRIKGRFDELTKTRKFKESIPDWMDELGVKELGEAIWSKELAAQNEQAKVILRVNKLKTTKEKLRAILMDLNIATEFHVEYPDALILTERANVFLTDAFKEGFLNKYAVMGLHENYNSQYLRNELSSHTDRIQAIYFEDFLTGKTTPEQAFEHALTFTTGLCGLEVDLDSIAGISASAASPTGFTAEQVRSFLYQTKGTKLGYLHICEGIANSENLVAKLIGYLVSDFIKAQIN